MSAISPGAVLAAADPLNGADEWNAAGNLAGNLALQAVHAFSILCSCEHGVTFGYQRPVSSGGVRRLSAVSVDVCPEGHSRRPKGDRWRSLIRLHDLLVLVFLAHQCPHAIFDPMSFVPGVEQAAVRRRCWRRSFDLVGVGKARGKSLSQMRKIWWDN